MDKTILLTYDYELFLGIDSGDIYNTLINPTNKILNTLDKYNAKGLFFIDTSFLLKIKNSECFHTIKKQIQDIIKKGHDIGLHLHPHWQDAKLTQKCRWKFDNYEHFRLHSFADEKIETITQDSYALLSEIIFEVYKNYKIDAFRAGGWCIQPFNNLAKIFTKIGIKYDLSVLPNMRDNDTPKHYYDYINCPKDKYIWRFSNDVLKEDKEGDFVEISNTVYDMNRIDLMKNRKLIRGYKISGDGKGAGKKKSFFEHLRRVRWNVQQIVSSDAIDIEIFKKYIHKINRDVIVYVSHPKLFSDNFKTISYKEIEV